MADKAETAVTANNAEIIDLAAWLQTPIGDYLRQWEQQHLNALTADIFGFNAVQIGSPRSTPCRPTACPIAGWPTTACRWKGSPSWKFRRW
jgi:hypothetical protein